jgi:hypothetical protein
MHIHAASNKKKFVLCEGNAYYRPQLLSLLICLLISFASAIQNLSNTGQGKLELEQQLFALQQEVQMAQECHKEQEQDYRREKEDLLLLVKQLRQNAQLADQEAKSKIIGLEGTVASVHMQLQSSQNEVQVAVANKSTRTLFEDNNMAHARELEAAKQQYKSLADKFRKSIGQLQESFASVVSEKDEKFNLLSAKLEHATVECRRCVLRIYHVSLLIGLSAGKCKSLRN